MRLTILHTNDIHGRVERLAQIATIVARERATGGRLLYLDGGDVEETSTWLSNVTKGVAMHRLLSVAGCDAATVGNACWLRYGPGSLAAHAEAAAYPLLLANFEPAPGTVPSVLFDDVGVFGLTDPFRGLFADTDFGWQPLDEVAVAKECARDLRARGAKLVILLSHLGLSTPHADWDDRRIARELQDDVDVIIGAHSHDLLPEGEREGRILIAQAGSYGDHVGRIEIRDHEVTASVERVAEEVEPSPEVLAEVRAIEAEVEVVLAEELGTVDRPLDAAWIAEMLRRRFGADVGLFAEGLTLGVVPPGTVTRGALWEASETAANPGVTTMTGAQLGALIARGNDPEFMAETPRPLRGRTRGRLHVAGLEPAELDPERSYLVGATDWELDAYGGYAEQAWGLRVRYDFPTIVREAIEEALRGV